MAKQYCIKCKKNNKQLYSKYKTIKNKKKYIGGKCKKCISKNKYRKSLKKIKGGFYDKPTTGEPTPITPSELTSGKIPQETLTLEQRWGEVTGDNVDDAGDVVYGADASVDYYGGDIEDQVNKLEKPEDPSGQETPPDESTANESTEEIQKGGKRFRRSNKLRKKNIRKTKKIKKKTKKSRR